jgi:hypothetical protein
MRNREFLLLSAFVLLAVSFAGCNNAAAATTSSAVTQPTGSWTIIPVVTTTAPPNSLFITANPADLPPLNLPPIAITPADGYYMVGFYEYGDGFSSIKDTCLLCHQAGVGYAQAQPGSLQFPGGSQFPLPPVWVGSRNAPGPWQVVPGSEADHTGRTNAQCPYCHTYPDYIGLSEKDRH